MGLNANFNFKKISPIDPLSIFSDFEYIFVEIRDFKVFEVLKTVLGKTLSIMDCYTPFHHNFGYVFEYCWMCFWALSNGCCLVIVFIGNLTELFCYIFIRATLNFVIYWLLDGCYILFSGKFLKKISFVDFVALRIY